MTLHNVQVWAGRTRQPTNSASEACAGSSSQPPPDSSVQIRGTKRKLEADSIDEEVRTKEKAKDQKITTFFGREPLQKRETYRVTLSLSPKLLINFPASVNDPTGSAVSEDQRAIEPRESTRVKKGLRQGRKKPQPSTGKSRSESKNYTNDVLISSNDTRPLPWGDPQVWAENRSDLCASVPYFDSYQGSTYTKNGIVKGMLLDQDAGVRQYMDDEVVIVRAGGSMGYDETGKTSVQVKNQDGTSSGITSFRNTMDRKVPLILIVGSKNIYCPSQIPHRYCIMAAFHVTDIWAEKNNGFQVWRFRMEKIDLGRKSWWAAEGPSTSLKSSTSVEVNSEACPGCQKLSTQIYKQGWICMNEHCHSHWTLNGKEPPADLDFCDEFLLKRTPFSGCLPPYSIIPKLPNPTGLQTVSKQCWQGIVCPQCGRCNPRINWDAWRCLACDFILAPPREIIPASAVMGDQHYEYQGHAIFEDWFEDDTIVTYKSHEHGHYRIHIYELADGIQVSHAQSNGYLNDLPGGANDVFRGLQQANLGLRRLESQCMTSGSRSAHFSKNYGLPYEYHVAQPDSTSFEDAPTEIHEAMRRSIWYAQHVNGDKMETVFNECLAVGYFTGGHMGYHDDGEDSLGPHIAAWSLGCPAWMYVRMKFIYYTGFRRFRKDKNGKEGKRYDPKLPIVPGCYAPEKRQELNRLANTLTSEELNAKAKVLLKGHKSSPPVIIKMMLRHGDLMSMHGALMQLYYEHTVVPTHELRFGLTCRYVKPARYSEAECSKGVLKPSKPYDGDLSAFEDWKKENDAIQDKASMRRRAAVSPI